MHLNIFVFIGKGCVDSSNCQVNHKGSSGMMEPVGAVNIVKRLYESYGIKTTCYLSDGDSKAFSQVAKFCEEQDWTIKKLECTNHVSKRVGSNLRKVRKDTGSTVKLPGKRTATLGGKGKLTLQAIDKIQSYYYWIIKTSNGDPKLMRKRILAMYAHISSTDKSPKHRNCEIAFCKYRQAKKDRQKYQHSAHFHIVPEVMKKVEHIFTRFAELDFLDKCSHGTSQNANESFNGGVWNLISKNGFANRELVEFGVTINVCLVNEGFSAVLDVLRELHIFTSPEMQLRCKYYDRLRSEKKERRQSYSPPSRKRARQPDETDGYEAGMGTY